MDAALAQAHVLGASDLHVKVPSQPRVRLGGVLKPLPDSQPARPADTEQLMHQVLASDTKGAGRWLHATPRSRRCPLVEEQ